MNLRYCDGCGEKFKELSRLEVRKPQPERGRVLYFCARCYQKACEHEATHASVPETASSF